MNDEAGRNQRGRARSSGRRALLGVASPFVGYFDRRFQDLHEHLDEEPALTGVVHQRFDQLLFEMRQMRDDVAADTDTIAELAFTLERFADLFTARMEDLAAGLTGSRRERAGELDSSAIELPFAYAIAGTLEPGASVAAVDGDARLPVGLAAIGLHVIVLQGEAADFGHAAISVVEGRVDDWDGPDEPLDAIFSLSGRRGPRVLTSETVDRFRKWLRPDGVLVHAAPLASGPARVPEQLLELLVDWRVEREAIFDRAAGGFWRRIEAHVDQPSGDGVVLIKAVPGV